MKHKLLAEVDSCMETIQRHATNANLYSQAYRLLGDCDLSDIAYTSIWQDSNGTVNLSLTLDSDKRNSRIAHVIARALHVRFAKAVDCWDKDRLNLTASVPANGDLPAFQITINGSQPATCKIVTIETPLTEEEIEAARAKALASVATVRIERSIKCTEVK